MTSQELDIIIAAVCAGYEPDTAASDRVTLRGAVAFLSTEHLLSTI